MGMLMRRQYQYHPATASGRHCARRMLRRFFHQAMVPDRGGKIEAAKALIGAGVSLRILFPWFRHRGFHQIGKRTH
jgi:hypothetical protein